MSFGVDHRGCVVDGCRNPLTARRHHTCEEHRRFESVPVPVIRENKSRSRIGRGAAYIEQLTLIRNGHDANLADYCTLILSNVSKQAREDRRDRLSAILRRDDLRDLL